MDREMYRERMRSRVIEDSPEVVKQAEADKPKPGPDCLMDKCVHMSDGICTTKPTIGKGAKCQDFMKEGEVAQVEAPEVPSRLPLSPKAV